MSAYDVAALYGDPPIAAAMVVCLYSLGKALWNENGSIRPMLLMSMPLWLHSAPAQPAGNPLDERYYPLTAQEEQSCVWLTENMEEDTRFATNQVHIGLSGRQAYCESFQYAVANMGDHAGDGMTSMNKCAASLRQITLKKNENGFAGKPT